MNKRFFLFLTVLFLAAFSYCSFSQTWQQMYDSAKANLERHYFYDADIWAEKALEIAKKEYKETDENYYKTISILSDINKYMYPIKGLDYAKIDSALSEKLFGPEHRLHAKALINLGYYYWLEDRWSDKSTLNKGFSIIKSKGKFSKNDSEYLLDYAYVNSVANDVTIYQNDFDYIFNFIEDNFDRSSNEFARMLSAKYWIANSKGNHQETESIQFERLNLHDATLGFESYNGYELLYTLINYYLNRLEYKKAIEYLNKMDILTEKLFQKRGYSHFLYLMGKYEADYLTGDFSSAENDIKQILELIESQLRTKSYVYYFNLSRLGNVQELRSKYFDALKSYQDCYKYYNEKMDTVEMAECLYQIGNVQQNLGNYSKAIDFITKSIEMFETTGREDRAISSFRALGVIQLRKKNYEEAIKLIKKSIDLTQRYFGDDYVLYIFFNAMLGGLYSLNGEFQKAEPLLKEYTDLIRRKVGKEHTLFADALFFNGIFYDQQGRYTHAETYYLECQEIYKKVYGEFTRSDEDLTYLIPQLYLKMDLPEDGKKSFDFMYDKTLFFVHQFFPYMNEEEKLAYWGKTGSNIDLYYNYSSRYSEELPELMHRMYNLAMSSKGLIVNSRKKAIRQARMMKKTYENWQSANEMWVNMVQNPRKAQSLGISIDSLKDAAFKYEQEIATFSSGFRREFDTTKVTWNDIKNKLNPDEAALEIVRFTKFTKEWTDTVIYAALIVKKDSEHPELVILENGNELEDKIIKQYKNSVEQQRQGKKPLYNDMAAVYHNFWKPIADKLEGINTIYLAPDGVYNQINLNTLYNPLTEKHVLEETDIRLLTNTKDLVEMEKYYTESTSHDAMLVGDPAFSLPGTNKKEEEPDYYLSRLFENIAEKGLPPLPGTKNEVRNISGHLELNKWEVHDYLGAEALESSLKNSKGSRILHIATHGVFLKDVEQIREMAGPSFQQQAYVENPLLRSMLMFAGAENTIKGESIDDKDDGILTAYEVMNMDLDNTELVVLSACETGLGEIKNGEGVYGMQRAFQIAGAKTLIMSLWTVNDKTTQELMTSFYDKWLSGKTKREAFREAQLELKAKYPGFYHWGAFVMVGE